MYANYDYPGEVPFYWQASLLLFHYSTPKLPLHIISILEGEQINLFGAIA